jgi:phosphoglycolate phosphatase-like HAD superfamily hydrolase
MPVTASNTSSSWWRRPGLDLDAFLGSAHARLDTALFDVDGVLIDTRRSYRLAVIHAAEHVVRVVNGLREAPSPLVSLEDVALFKLAGGFNNDWDATQLFAALWTARLREWRGAPEAEVSLAEWASRARVAALAGHGGPEWVRAAVPASAIPSAEVARWAHDEHYWGAELVRAHYAHEPIYAPDARGFVHNEEALLEPGLLPALAELGMRKLGLITGRVGPEVNWAVTFLNEAIAQPAGIAFHDTQFGRSPFASVVPGTVFAKPDPRALELAVRTLESRGALYVGDTADDLDLVLRYRHEAQPADPRLPPVLAVAVAEGAAATAYQERGADIVIPRVGELPAALVALGVHAE